MLLGGIDLLLRAELFQSADDTEAGVARLDDVIHIAVGSGVVWISEGLAVFFFLLSGSGSWIFGSSYILSEDDFYSTCRAHDSDLSRRPSQVDVGA